eukprot:5451103-Prymnesium_polylepis.1
MLHLPLRPNHTWPSSMSAAQPIVMPFSHGACRFDQALFVPCQSALRTPSTPQLSASSPTPFPLPGSNPNVAHPICGN